MAEYVLSNAADADLDDIYTYSFETYGESKADAIFIARILHRAMDVERQLTP